MLAELLVARGISQSQDAYAFLNPEPSQLNDPFLMLGMTAAAERLERAIANREPVLLYGDYDVDGVSAVVLLKTMLTLMGHAATHYRYPHAHVVGIVPAPAVPAATAK